MSAATLHQLTNHIAGSIRQAGILVSFCQDLASRISKMSNIKSLADLGGDESDHDDDHNDYYAGGEKRHVHRTERAVPRLSTIKHILIFIICLLQWSIDPWCPR